MEQERLHDPQQIADLCRQQIAVLKTDSGRRPLELNIDPAIPLDAVAALEYGVVDHREIVCRATRNSRNNQKKDSKKYPRTVFHKHFRNLIVLKTIFSVLPSDRSTRR